MKRILIAAASALVVAVSAPVVAGPAQAAVFLKYGDKFCNPDCPALNGPRLKAQPSRSIHLVPKLRGNTR